MKVRVTKPFSAIPTEKDLHPRHYQVGDIAEDYAAACAIRNGYGEKIAGDDAPESPAGVRARLASPYEGPDHEGNPAKFAEGAVVEGAIAEFFIAQGIAIEVSAEKKPAANKAKGAAPSNK